MLIAVLAILLIISSQILLLGLAAKHYLYTVFDETAADVFNLCWALCSIGLAFALWRTSYVQNKTESACEMVCAPYASQISSDDECYCNSSFGWNLADK